MHKHYALLENECSSSWTKPGPINSSPDNLLTGTSTLHTLTCQFLFVISPSLMTVIARRVIALSRTVEHYAKSSRDKIGAIRVDSLRILSMHHRSSKSRRLWAIRHHFACSLSARLIRGFTATGSTVLTYTRSRESLQ